MKNRKPKTATMKDVAKYAGLSVGTVSKYINGGDVKEKNKNKLDKAIHKLNFHVNNLARGLKNGRSKTIGVLIPSLDNYFCTNLVEHIENKLSEYGYGLLVSDYQDDSALEQKRLNSLAARMVEGIVVVPSFKAGFNENIINSSQIPIVFVDRVFSQAHCDAVVIDNVSISQKVTDYLLDKGHQRIAIILGPDSISTSKERKQGFIKAMNDSQVEIIPEYVSSGHYSINHGFHATLDFLKLPRRPTAIFATSFDLTLGMLKAINQKGISIPTDISVIGFDNLLFLSVFNPTLTIVEQPMQEISDKVVELLLKRINTKNSFNPSINKMQARLIEGSSVMNCR
ncbi:LacI family transcriptional regulator [Oenococcus sp. UCMA 17063]|nr:LacI family transcriptional regulator [Oenococcus sp. UCMA 17063]